MFKQFSIPILVLVTLAAVSLCTIACNIDISGPGQSISNGIPFVWQETSDYCVPACIQMSAKFYRLTPPTQTDLFVDMGGQSGFGVGGVSLGSIAPAMALYGGVWDAVMDSMFYDNWTFLARQISAATQPTPVIALINQGYHSGVINGGQWHKATDPNTGETMYVWDQLNFHDPLVGPNQLYTAARWTASNCGEANPVCYQAISNSAAQAGPRTMDEYDVVMYGGGVLRGPKQY